MTLLRAVTGADLIKPNAFSPVTKTRWINECEGMAQTQVFLLPPAEIIEYDWDEDQQTELMVHAPHDKLYGYYLAAMIDFANGEYNKYQNTMTMFNAAFSEFMRWFATTYRPADNPGDWRHKYAQTE